MDREDFVQLTGGRILEMIPIQEKIELNDLLKENLLPILSSIDTDKINQLLHEDYTIIDKNILDIIRSNSTEKKFRKMQSLLEKIDKKSQMINIKQIYQENQSLLQGVYEDTYEIEHAIQYYHIIDDNNP